MLDIIKDTLALNGFNASPSNSTQYDFIIDNKTYKVLPYQLTGVVTKVANIDYRTYKECEADNIIFIADTWAECIYIISNNNLKDQVENGLVYNKKNFKIAESTSHDICLMINYSTFQNIKKMTRYNIRKIINSSDIRRDNAKALQYEMLVNKITKQFMNKISASWEDIKSMAWEGLVIAFNTYDESRSNMSFTKFAAYAIRNNILTSLDNESRTVKMSAYAQKKATDAGEVLFNSVRIDVGVTCGDDEKKPKEIKLGLYENEKFSDGDPYNYLYSRLCEEFSTRDCEMFYMSFGLNDRELTKGKDIAIKFGVSEGCVSQRIKKMCKYIKQDTELCEMLMNMNS